MDIVEDLSGLGARDPASPVCVLVRPADHALADRAADVLHANRDLPAAGPRAHRRPRAHVDDDQVAVVAFAAGEAEEPLAVQLHATDLGLLVVGADTALAAVRRAVHPVEGDACVALAAALVGIARQPGETLDNLADAARQLDAEVSGYTSAPERRKVGRMRTRLFTLQELEASQHRMLAPEEELAQALPGSARRLLRQADAVFDDNRATAARLYALLGDVLTQQSSVVTERLTLVSTIFLPLSLGTGFFGMNFGWMTERVGSLSAFVALGIVLPVLLTGATMVAIRRLSAPT